MTDINDFKILKMPRLPRKVKSWLTSAASPVRPFLTWAHINEGYLYAADGVRVHALRIDTTDEGHVKLPKSLPAFETPRIWDVVKPYLDETRISLIVNAGDFLDRSQMLINRANSNRHNWFRVCLYLDHQVLSMIPATRDRRSSGVVSLIKRGDEVEGLKAYVDIRYMPSALMPFDPTAALTITLPYSDRCPIRFQQSNLISLVMPLEE
jgi:hypothetical protein